MYASGHRLYLDLYVYAPKVGGLAANSAAIFLWHVLFATDHNSSCAVLFRHRDLRMFAKQV